eukprot:3730164-Rhodomonas_salina.1
MLERHHALTISPPSLKGEGHREQKGTAAITQNSHALASGGAHVEETEELYSRRRRKAREV